MSPPLARRPTAQQRGYSSDWRARSTAFRKAHPLCLGCEAIGRIQPATLVDHIKPHRGDQALFWDEANWQPCCRWHHELKATLERKFELGLVGAAALRLDSPGAIALSRQRGTWIGDDGWPQL
jgi:5-methylcytosine-specific restriction protein A